MIDSSYITGRIIGAAMDVHKVLGPGYLESVYKNALNLEIGKLDLQTSTEVPIEVLYKKEVVGNFSADLVVENQVIIELKSVQRLGIHHEIQLVNYLTATNTEIGLLINFGSESLEFKKKFKTPKSNPVNPVNPV